MLKPDGETLSSETSMIGIEVEIVSEFYSTISWRKYFIGILKILIFNFDESSVENYKYTCEKTIFFLTGSKIPIIIYKDRIRNVSEV